jgi:hypothetical protein
VRQSGHDQGVPADVRQCLHVVDESGWDLLHLHCIVDGSCRSVWWKNSNECLVEVPEIEVHGTTTSIGRCTQLPTFKASSVKAAAWLATPLAKASIVVIEESFIVNS